MLPGFAGSWAWPVAGPGSIRALRTSGDSMREEAGLADFRWGIVGAGAVARKFVLGLRAAQSARAVAVMSRSPDSARGFAQSLGVPRVHATLDDLLADRELDAVYIASPPAAHAEQALACIAAGRSVLIEKPFAVNLADATRVVEAAQRGSVFCMEAMWTRFLPAVRAAKAMVDRGELGELRNLSASFGLPELVEGSNHHFDPTQGGGALLDRGVYAVSLAHHLLGKPDSVVSSQLIGSTGVDEEVVAILRHPHGALTTMQASLRTPLPNDLRLAGTQAVLHLPAPIYRPSGLVITPVQARAYGKAGPSRAEALKESSSFHQALQRFAGLRDRLSNRRARSESHFYAGNGYHYQADEVMTCVRAGQTESRVMPLADTLAVMQTLGAIRTGGQPGAR